MFLFHGFIFICYRFLRDNIDIVFFIQVVDESSVVERPDVAKAFVVKAEWFWTSVQKEYSLDEKEYLFDDYIEHAITSPGVRRESQTATPSSTSR